MKLIIFAGGAGTRLWPLSRVNSPKQFDKIFNGKSTIRLAFERVAPVFGAENIFIQTNPLYCQIIAEQLPELPAQNIIAEPERRDLGAAVCLGMNELNRRCGSSTVAILWSDHLMDNEGHFTAALRTAGEMIKEDPRRFIFFGEKPRFANNNLGWIKVGKILDQRAGFDICDFSGWKYRPPMGECEEMYNGGEHLWNPGYFVTSTDFILDKYRELAPEIYEKVVAGDYANTPITNFDAAILEKIDLSSASVIKTDMGWSDPGTLYALKEALETNKEDNVVNGKVIACNCKDSLLYNLEKGKIMAAIGLDGVVVVNTEDALLVLPKNEVIHITSLVKKMREEGLEKYL